MSSPSYSCPRLPAIGSEQCSAGPCPPNSPVDAAGSKVSKRPARRLEDFIIRSSLDSVRRSVSPGSEQILEQGTILNPPDQVTPTPTCGRTIHPLPGRDLSLDASHYEETLRAIGMRYYLMQRREILDKFPLTYKYVIIGNVNFNFRSLRAIASDHYRPIGIEKTVNVFFGRTGTGKSRRAWEEAGVLAYPKDPRSKWWDGYKGEEAVVIDEFRGTLDVSHLLRWLDRYPVRVECKGSSVPLQATKIWITSNLAPGDWYPELDVQTKEALLRRFNNIVEFE